MQLESVLEVQETTAVAEGATGAATIEVEVLEEVMVGTKEEVMVGTKEEAMAVVTVATKGEINTEEDTVVATNNHHHTEGLMAKTNMEEVVINNLLEVTVIAPPHPLVLDMGSNPAVAVLIGLSSKVVVMHHHLVVPVVQNISSPAQVHMDKTTLVPEANTIPAHTIKMCKTNFEFRGTNIVRGGVHQPKVNGGDSAGSSYLFLFCF